MKKRYMIGIDPGVNTGFSIYDRLHSKLLLVSSAPFWEIIQFFNAFDFIENPDQYMFKYNYFRSVIKNEFEIVIENPNFNKPIFEKERFNINTITRRAQNVGSNKRDAKLLMEYFEIHNILCTPVRPISSKLNAKTFKNLTKYPHSTNQHGRDAAMLVFGK